LEGIKEGDNSGDLGVDVMIPEWILREIGLEGVEWIRLAQERYQ
jgi:hypothetical protein